MPVIAQTRIGVVREVFGSAVIVAADGSERPVRVGDVVRAGDVILTKQDSFVEIVQDLPAPVAAAGDSETDRVIGALAAGDPSAAPAAVLAGGDAGGLSPGLRVERISEALAPGALQTLPGDGDADTVVDTEPTDPPEDQFGGVAGPTINVDAPDNSTDSTPTISGSTNLVPGRVVTLTVTDAAGTTQTFFTTVNADGSFSADVPLPLAEGSYTVVATGTDGGGRVASDTDQGSVVFGNTPPVITVSAPELTNDSTPTLNGTTDAPAGTVVTLTITDAAGAVQTVTAVVRPDGSYGVDVGSPLADGPYTVVADVSTAGGSASASDAGVVDTTPPAPTISLDPVTGDDVVNVAESGQAEVTLSGRVGGDARPGDTVTLTLGGQTFTTTVAADGGFAVNVSGALLAAAAAGGVAASVTRTDAAGNSATASVTRPYTLDLAPVAVADTAAQAEDGPAASGDVTPGTPGQDTDPEGGRLAVTGVAAGSGVPGSGGVGTAVAGDWGSVVVQADGRYAYTPGAIAQSLRAGESVTDTFSYTIVDPQGNTATATLTVTITGADDVAVIGGDVSGRVVEDGVQVSSGVLTVADPDAGQAAFRAQTDVAGNYGRFSVDRQGRWSYVLDNAADRVQVLAEAETVTDVFTVTSVDGTTREVTVTVVGSDDAAVVTAGTGDVIEDVSPEATGQLTVSDIDSALPSFEAGTQAGTYGSLALAANGQWRYTLGAAAQALAEGEVATEQFTVTLSDGSSTTVTINITGTDDAPVVSTGTGRVVEDDEPSVSGRLTATDIDGPAPGFVGGTQAGAWGALVVAGDGAWTYTLSGAAQALAAGELVSELFTVGLTDGTTTTVTITVIGTDDLPVISAGTGAVVEDRSPTASGTLTATDVDNPALAFVAGSQDGRWGRLALAADGQWSYTLGDAAQALAEGQVVVERFTVTLNDGSTTTVTINVTGTNDPAVIPPVVVNLIETNAVLTTGGTLSITDPDSPLTFVPQTAAAGTYGSFTLAADGTWSYTANSAHDEFVAGQVYTDTFTVTSADGSTSTVTVNITGTNDAPSATNDVYVVAEDGTLSMPVLVNDTDIDSTVLTVQSFTQPTFGRVTLNPDGTFSYRADPDFYNTTPTFATVVDTSLGLPNNVFLIHPEQLANAGDYMIAPPRSLTTNNITALGRLPDGDFILRINNGDDVERVFNVVGNGAAPDFVITVPANSAGILNIGNVAAGTLYRVDGINATATTNNTALGLSTPVERFTYTVSDGQGGSATATVNITVTPTNDAPQARPDSRSLNEDVTSVTGNVIRPGSATSGERNDTDPDGDALTITGVVAGSTTTPPAGGVGTSIAGTLGSLVLNADGSFTYVPGAGAQALNVGQTAFDTFTYSVSDGQGGTASTTLQMRVSGANDAPAIDLDGNDSSGATGSGYRGSHVSAGPVPIADADLRVADIDSPLLQRATVTLTNPQAGDVLTVGVLPAGITASLSGNVLTLSGAASPAAYAQALLAVGYDSTAVSAPAGDRLITVSVSDGNLTSNLATSTITVIDQNDAPTNTLPGPVAGLEDTRITIAGVSVADPDEAGSSNSFKLGSVELSVASGSLRLALAAGASVTAGAIDSASVTISGTQAAINSTLATLSYLGNADFNGSDSLVVTTRDGLGLSDRDSLQITVGAVNDAPAGADRTLTIDEDTSVVLARTDFGFADAPGESNALLSVTVNAPSGGVLSLNGVPVTGSVSVTAAQLDAGLLRYTPAANVNGAAAASFTFQVRDDGGTANGGQDTDPTPNRITFDIRSVNDAPVSPPGFRAPPVTLSEDDAGGSGQTVAALFGFNGTSFVDPDGSEPGNGSFAGVYLRAQQTQQNDGQWQFSVNGGASWSAVGVLNNSNALFLAADARLRFVPSADYFNAPGTVTDALTVRLADASVAPPASGSRTDISAIVVGGGSLPIGANDILLPAFVQPVNDAPVLAGSSAPATHVENGAAVTVNSALTLADVDNTTLSSATVSIGSGFVPGDALALAGSFGNIASSYDATTGVLTLTSAGATATLAQWQSALRAVSFSHVGEDPGSGPRTIGFRVNDGQSANNLSNGVDSTVNVLPVNDAPTVSIAQPSSPAFTEAAGLGTQGAAVTVFSGVAVSAVEAGQTIQALTFTIGGIRDGLNEELRLDGATILLNSVGRSGTTPDNRVAFTVSYGGSTDNATATITLTKSGGISAAAMQSVLEGISYRNTNLDNPTVGDRPFTITRIQDNGGTANGGVDVSFPNLLSTVRVVGVNDGPVALNDEPTANAVAGTATAVTGNAVTGAGTGNVADTDPENAVLRITGVAAGVTEAVLGTTAITSPVSVKGVYGTLTFNADGSYSYLIDNADADTLALPVGGRASDVFSYTVTDSGGIGIGGALTDTGQITIAVAGPGTLTSSSTPINPLVYGVLGEYFGYNDNRTGQANDPAYNPAPGSTSRWHFDDGRASSSLGGGSGATGGANLESIGDALFVINGRNVSVGGGAVTGTATRSLDGATDARWIATDFDYGFSPQVNGSLGSNPKATGGSGAAALPSGSLRDYIGTDINTLQITGGIGNTTDAVVRTFGYIYQPGGFVDFRITADDGFTLILNGQQVAEFGANQSPTVREFIGKELQAGMNLLELVYWEQGGNARLRVEAKASGAAAGDYINLLSLDNSALFQPGLQPVLGANQDIVETATNRVWEIRTGGTFNGTVAADSVTGSAARDQMSGGDGNDSLRAGDGADNVTGGNGNDTLLGEGGADVINGDAGNDSVSGGLGSDFLSGGEGDDIVIGGAGWDRLAGGTGTDTFVWNLGDRGVAAGRAENPAANTTAQFNGVSSNGSRAQDFISDFDARPAASGGDVLDLRDLLVGETPATLDRFLDFNVVAGATPSTQIRISSTGGFSGGTYNSAVEDQRIVLEGVDIRASLGLAANASDALIVQTLIDRAKLLVDA